MLPYYGTVAYFSFALVLNSKYKGCGQKTVNLPLLGEMSVVSLIILISCVIFAIIWAANRKASSSWIGQDILVSYHKKPSILYLLSWILAYYNHTLFIRNLMIPITPMTLSPFLVIKTFSIIIEYCYFRKIMLHYISGCKVNISVIVKTKMEIWF